jgi:hypothetical protein
MEILTIDFETYYDKKFSLSKLTTEEYIRDERFEVIGFCVKQGGREEKWYAGDVTYLQRVLLSYNWKESFCLAHNTMFDGAILNWKFGINPKVFTDTLCIARALFGVETSQSLSALAKKYRIGEKGTEVLATLGKRREDFSKKN